MKMRSIAPYCVAAFTICATSLAATGGVSGGGGNVLYPVDPKDPASTQEVRDVIQEAHRDMASYLRGKEDKLLSGSLSPGESAQFGALFHQPGNVIKISETNSLEVESERPCLDADAKPVDASIRGDVLGKVCMSSFSIAKKVERQNLRAQTAALLVHEFSELAGFDEESAVQIQALVFADFQER